MKKLMKLLLILAITVCMGITSFAAEKLPAPSWVKWGATPGTVAWEVIPAAEGEYDGEFFKDGETLLNMKWHGNSKGIGFIYDQIYESGDYTFRISALGDQTNNEDSDFSQMSEVYHYVKPDVSFPEATNVRWSPEEPTVALWDAPVVDAEYKKYLSYRITLYADGEEAGDVLIDNEPWMEDLSIDMGEEAVYTFSVEAISKNIDKITHSGKVYSDGHFDVPDNNQELNDKLDQMEDATPSDALKALTKDWKIKDIAVGMQSNTGILGKISDLEQRYLDENNAVVEKNVTQDVGMNSEDIEIIGAGLNLASSSNAVQFNVKKPDKEANVDSSLYKNTFQVNLSLGGTVEHLRIPVTITMPIPSGIKPSRLTILHYKKDGSYDIIWPRVNQEDNTITFTVTEFSIFAIAEKVEKEPEEDNNTSSGSSGSSGSGKSVNTGVNGNTSGTWSMGENGWQFKKTDGTPVKDSWLRHNNLWYFLDSNGFMCTKWLYRNQNWYYLSPEKGTMEGSMKTGWIYDPDYQKWFFTDLDGRLMVGWQMIDSKWYYFNPVSDGAQGIMAENTTVDGYKLGENGAMLP